ncbi:MAG: sugar phosphate nucleotidyltransferase, partial [Candidatus Nanohaloarchaea archaeon]|nr:sugar phosphate nucleotidyltransferase [Candidatus Nanohaloarchaea archaeon]
MKGVVLAGGRGTRLRPMTYVVNKHILPVYDEPMIFYPVKTLADNGIKDILVISGPEHIGKYIQLLEEEFDNVNFSYKVQKEPKGIAHALKLAEGFVDDQLAMVLGDNIVMDDLQAPFKEFEESDAGAKIYLQEVDQPARYGIATVEGDKITKIVEKPESPQSNLAVAGIYLYENDVFEKIDRIDPSERGELEITDVNQLYIDEDALSYGMIDGFWFDAGTPEGLFKASQHVREYKKE